ncbi:MAG: hypothetical protein U9O64_00915 [Campylobacterota bacterium]|nr:hypothetical protein [Campylobacterota bacterium]
MHRFILYTLLFYLFTSLLPAASIRSQVSLLEASENLKLKSQQIVVHYLVYHSNPKKFFYEKETAIQNLEGLDREFERIDRSTKEEESQSILMVLNENRTNIQELLKKPVNDENLETILQLSDTMLESASSLTKLLDFELLSEEAKMLIHLKNISFLIENMTKYYMVNHLQANQKNSEKLNHAISKMTHALLVLNDYNFNRKNSIVLTQLNSYWEILKSYYQKDPKLKMENIVLLTSREVQKYAFLLEKYHSKEQ